MSHPYASNREDKAGRARAKSLTSAYARGGKASHSDEAQDRKLIKSMINKAEHKVSGKATGGRLDKFARGGKAKKPNTQVNIAIVAPPGGSQPPGPGGVAPAAPAILPPPGGGPSPMMPPGPMAPPMKRGGKVPMTAGAESGVGRLQKKRIYGKNARK